MYTECKDGVVQSLLNSAWAASGGEDSSWREYVNLGELGEGSKQHSPRLTFVSTEGSLYIR